MEIRKVASSSISITEEIHLGWSGGKAFQASRSLVAFDGTQKAAVLCYREEKDFLRITELGALDGFAGRGFETELLRHLNVDFRTTLISVPSSFEEHSWFADLIAERQINSDRDTKIAELKAFEAMCIEASRTIKELVERDAVLGSRIEAYTRFPGYLTREENIARLNTAISEAPTVLYRLRLR